jgi:hypothetical protein
MPAIQRDTRDVRCGAEPGAQRSFPPPMRA